MSKHTASGARRGGDEYQDLQSAGILVNWLEHPLEYTWVKLESMDGSLDDIQYYSEGEGLTLQQVKFGVDSAREWTWEELTERSVRKSRSKDSRQEILNPSLIMKWASSLAVARSQSEKVNAGLITNRKCNAQIRAALKVDGKLDFSRVPGDVRVTLENQLDGQANVLALFNSFVFRFDDTSLEVLTDVLYSRFCRNGGTQYGWYGLLDNIKRWINYQHEPQPDGKILLDDVKAAAHWHQPLPIPQGFTIPEDYVPPKQWSETEVEPQLLEGCDGRVIVVTGSPGIGKSTYLSWIVGDLVSRDIPVVRHHFYLSASDTTQRRNAWQTAADTLIGQLKAVYPHL